MRGKVVQMYIRAEGYKYSFSFLYYTSESNSGVLIGTCPCYLPPYTTCTQITNTIRMHETTTTPKHITTRTTIVHYNITTRTPNSHGHPPRPPPSLCRSSNAFDLREGIVRRQRMLSIQLLYLGLEERFYKFLVLSQAGLSGVLGKEESEGFGQGMKGKRKQEE